MQGEIANLYMRSCKIILQILQFCNLLCDVPLIFNGEVSGWQLSDSAGDGGLAVGSTSTLLE